MANKYNSTLISGVIAALLLIVIYAYAIYAYNPSTEQVNQTASPVAAINANQISNVTKEIGQRQSNGNFPISVADQDSKNPFNNLE
jgi:hypothetical protein